MEERCEITRRPIGHDARSLDQAGIAIAGLFPGSFAIDEND